MKKILIVLIAFLLVSCASISPVGEWSYTISGTPEGDRTGVMTVSKKDKKQFNAVLKTNEGELPFNSFNFASKTKKSTGQFDYQGMSISFDAILKENKKMEGSISTQGMDFPFKASRTK